MFISIIFLTFVRSENRTWYPQYFTDTQKWRGVDLSHDGRYIVFAAKNNYLYLSTDYGDNFKACTEASTNKWTSVTVSASGVDMVAIGINSYVYTSINSGENWSTNNNELQD